MALQIFLWDDSKKGEQVQVSILPYKTFKRATNFDVVYLQSILHLWIHYITVLDLQGFPAGHHKREGHKKNYCAAVQKSSILEKYYITSISSLVCVPLQQCTNQQ